MIQYVFTLHKKYLNGNGSCMGVGQMIWFMCGLPLLQPTLGTKNPQDINLTCQSAYMSHTPDRWLLIFTTGAKVDPLNPNPKH